MKKEILRTITKLAVFACISFGVVSCSQFPINTVSNPQTTQQPQDISTLVAEATKLPQQRTIDPKTAGNLATSKQVNFNAAANFIWLPEGQSMVLASNNELDLFQLTSSKFAQPAARIQADNPVLLSASYSTNKIAWTGKDNFIHLWDLEKQVALPNMGEGTSPITGLSFAKLKPELALAGYDKTISIWDADSQQKLIAWNTSAWLTELSFSPDNKQIAGVDLQGFSVQIYNADTGEEVKKVKWGDSASAALYTALVSPDWSKIAWVARSIVQLMDAGNEAYGPMLEHEDYVSDVAWAPNSQVIATAAGATVNGQFSPVVQLWDVQTGKLLKTLIQSAGVIRIEFSPDGSELAVLLSGGVLQLYTSE
jgi:WD40 repeat protein